MARKKKARRSRPADIKRERGGLGKFEGGSSVTEKLYDIMLEGGSSEECGDPQSAYGAYSFIDLSDEPLIVDEGGGERSKIVAAILHEDSQGFVEADEFDNLAKARAAWAETVAEISSVEAEGLMDYITSERSEVTRDMERVASRYRRQFGRLPDVDILIDRWGDTLEQGLPDDADVTSELEGIAEEALAEAGRQKNPRGEAKPSPMWCDERGRRDMTRSKTSRRLALRDLKALCQARGLYVATWSPGDGVTRYRFFEADSPQSYFSGDGVYTALGMREARAFARGRGVLV